jgi:hypothetical protein
VIACHRPAVGATATAPSNTGCSRPAKDSGPARIREAAFDGEVLNPIVGDHADRSRRQLAHGAIIRKRASRVGMRVVVVDRESTGERVSPMYREALSSRARSSMTFRWPEPCARSFLRLRRVGLSHWDEPRLRAARSLLEFDLIFGAVGRHRSTPQGDVSRSDVTAIPCSVGRLYQRPIREKPREPIEKLLIAQRRRALPI